MQLKIFIRSLLKIVYLFKSLEKRDQLREIVCIGFSRRLRNVISSELSSFRWLQFLLIVVIQPPLVIG